MKDGVGAVPQEEIFDLFQLKKAAFIIRALNHPTRQAIFDYLAKNPNKTVTDLMTFMQIEQPVISQHLAILRRAKIIFHLKNGKFVHYFLNKVRVEEIGKLLSVFSNDDPTTRVIAINERD
ncbi:MAG: metalloregulator ArsR/SmtB family transcription factor [Ginsengibacter sp.]